MFTKIGLLTLSLAACSAMAMTNLPNGSFSGQGHWKDNTGASGDYSTAAVVANNGVSSTYTFNGQSKSFTMATPLDQNGFFPVTVAGTNVGSGYCWSVQCHYTISQDGGTLEETLTFYQTHLYRTGSKTVNGKTIIWEEALDRSSQLKK
jgi:hypothetical protein